MRVILVYDGDRQAAEGIADALRATGRDVRVLDSFVGAGDLALQLKPEAVLFSVDRNSVVTARGLGQVLVALGIPLIVIGTARQAYSVFTSGVLASASDPVWALERRPSPARVNEVVAKALAERPALRLDPAAFGRRRRRAVEGFGAVLLAMGLALGAIVLHDVPTSGAAASEPPARAVWSVIILLLASSARTAWNAIAAARRRLRVPARTLMSLVLTASLVAWGFRFIAPR